MKNLINQVNKELIVRSENKTISTSANKILKLQKLRCSNCVRSVEQKINKLPKIKIIKINLITSQINYCYDYKQINPGTIETSNQNTGFSSLQLIQRI